MSVRDLLAKTPADLEAEKRQLEEAAFLASFDASQRRARHGRIARRPHWLLALLGKDSAAVQFARWSAHRHDGPEPGGRARHLAYRAAKRRAAAR